MAEQGNAVLRIGGLRLEHELGRGIHVDPKNQNQRGLLDFSEAFALAEWLKRRASVEDEHLMREKWRAERHMKQKEKRREAFHGPPQRYWFGFTTTTLSPAEPYPFPVWPSDNLKRGGVHVLVTLIEASISPAELVLDYWPDAVEVFCAAKSASWEPDPIRYAPQRTEVSP